MPRFVADAIPQELRRALNVLDGHTIPAEVLAIEITIHRSGVETFVLTAVGHKHASTIRAGAQVTWSGGEPHEREVANPTFAVEV